MASARGLEARLSFVGTVRRPLYVRLPLVRGDGSVRRLTRVPWLPRHVRSIWSMIARSTFDTPPEWVLWPHACACARRVLSYQPCAGLAGWCDRHSWRAGCLVPAVTCSAGSALSCASVGIVLCASLRARMPLRCPLSLHFSITVLCCVRLSSVTAVFSSDGSRRVLALCAGSSSGVRCDSGGAAACSCCTRAEA